MNKAQLQYAVERLGAVAQQKLSVIKQKHTTKSPRFDGPALVKLIKAGTIKLHPGCPDKIICYTDIGHIFADLKKYDKNDVFDKAAYDKEAAPINAEVTRIQDQLYLGDAKEALALIEAFTAKKF